MIDFVHFYFEYNFEHVAVCLGGLLEWNVVESYNSQVYYLPEH